MDYKYIIVQDFIEYLFKRQIELTMDIFRSANCVDVSILELSLVKPANATEVFILRYNIQYKYDNTPFFQEPFISKQTFALKGNDINRTIEEYIRYRESFVRSIIGSV